MKEITGNLWTAPADWRGITTNGFVKSNGTCVMGRGCAFEATQKFPTLAIELGRRITTLGNQVHLFPERRLFSFPVKHRWMDDADPDLIVQSAQQLASYVAAQDPGRIWVLPRPGCGNGRLRRDAVKPLIEFLPDNVHIITFGR